MRTAEEIRARKNHNSWKSEKLFQNGNEWFEFNCPPLNLKVGKRLIQFRERGLSKQMIGAATIRSIKNN